MLSNYTHLEKALTQVKVGGRYFLDDLSPQPFGPAEHAAKVPPLPATPGSHAEFFNAHLPWATGPMLLVRR